MFSRKIENYFKNIENFNWKILCFFVYKSTVKNSKKVLSKVVSGLEENNRFYSFAFPSQEHQYFCLCQSAKSHQVEIDEKKF